jgi:peptide/nickel transport system substrate-binding protein
MRYWIIIFACLPFLSGCLDSLKEDRDKTVFRYNEAANITSLDPAFARDQANIWAVHQLFNGLVQLNEKLEILPCIAKSWEISDEGKKYTFHLRNDVFFHDSQVFPGGKGRSVSASDFVYSFTRVADPGIASPGAWVFNYVSVTDQKYMFAALNDSTLVIHLRNPFPPFLGLLTTMYCSVIPHEAIKYKGNDFRKNPVGTGPFRFKMWKEGVKLVFVRNPEYFECENGVRLPYLDAVSITFLPDKQSAFLEFMKGNLDFISGIDASYKDELLTRNGTLNPRHADKIKLLTQSYLNTEYLGFLVDRQVKPFTPDPVSNKKVRQAINYSFDRQKMITFLRNNIGTPGTGGIIPKGMPSYDPEKISYNYNPEKARQLLAEAGYPNGKGLADISLSTTADYLDICKYIQRQVEEIGINLKIDVVPPAALKEMKAQAKVSFFRASWIADYPDEESYLSLFYSRNFCPAGPNYTHFSSKTFDDLYEKSMGITVDSVRHRYYRQMNQLIVQEAPVVILYYDQVLRFVQKNIDGLGSDPMNMLSLKRVRKKG